MISNRSVSGRQHCISADSVSIAGSAHSADPADNTALCAEGGITLTYLEAKNYVLKLVRQYSVAGQKIADTYNEQADNLNRIAQLLDDAIGELADATGGCGLYDLLPLRRSSARTVSGGGWLLFALPEDCSAVFSVLRSCDGELAPVCRARMMAQRAFAIPEDTTGELLLEYVRKPRRLGEHPADAAVLDGTEQMHTAACFYAAAWLVLQEDSFAYASLYNKYEDKAAKLRPGVKAQWDDVPDVYAGAFGGGLL